MAPNNDAAVAAALDAFNNRICSSIRAAAHLYHVPESTVRARQSGTPTRAQAYQQEQLLSSSQEKMLVRWYLDLEGCGRAPTPS